MPCTPGGTVGPIKHVHRIVEAATACLLPSGNAVSETWSLSVSPIDPQRVRSACQRRAAAGQRGIRLAPTSVRAARCANMFSSPASRRPSRRPARQSRRMNAGVYCSIVGTDARRHLLRQTQEEMLSVTGLRIPLLSIQESTINKSRVPAPPRRGAGSGPRPRRRREKSRSRPLPSRPNDRAAPTRPPCGATPRRR